MNRLNALCHVRASFSTLAILAGSQACAAMVAAQDVPEVGVQTAALVSDGTCSTDMWDAITRANQGANWLLNNALENINTAQNQALRTTWFGSGQDAPNAAQDILFRMIDMRLFTSGQSEVSFHCERAEEPACRDRPGAYAYHLDGESDIIHLCPLYFTFDHNQGDFNGGVSQVGGLLHELSHLDGTSDFDGSFYGEGPCRALARASSATAILNADSWRYYLMQVP